MKKSCFNLLGPLWFLFCIWNNICLKTISYLSRVLRFSEGPSCWRFEMYAMILSYHCLFHETNVYLANFSHRHAICKVPALHVRWWQNIAVLVKQSHNNCLLFDVYSFISLLKVGALSSRLKSLGQNGFFY